MLFKSLPPLDDTMQHTIQVFLTDYKLGLSSQLAKNSTRVSMQESLLNEETQEDSDEEEDSEENDDESEEEDSEEDESDTEDNESDTSSCKAFEVSPKHSTISAHKHQSGAKRLPLSNDGNQPCLKKTKWAHQCSYCGYNAKCLSQLKRHLVKHTGEKPFSCKKCNRRFSRSDHVKVHMLIHTKNEPFKCSICSKEFTSQSAVNNHQTDKHGAQSTACKKKVHSLSEHQQKTCDTERPYTCDHCQNVYKTTKSLRQHITTKHCCYKCAYCPHTYVNDEKLLVHSLTKHGREQPTFECGICNEKFTSCDSLTCHFKVHDEEWEKSRTPIVSSSDVSLSHDGKKVIYSCAQCGHTREYANKESLRKHIRKYHS